MITAHSATAATLSVVIIGLFMSGSYPTTFAAAGPLMGDRSSAGRSTFASYEFISQAGGENA